MHDIRSTNVCVIGGAGFLGSHLVDHLIEDRNCQVLVLDNLISGNKKHLHKDAVFQWFDIRDSEDELVQILRRHDIQYVFNYAAEPYIPECFERPKHFFYINAVAVLNVLEACRRAGVKAILQVSSAEIYGDSKGKIKEDASVVAHSTYGVSKMAADGLVQVRWKEAGVPAIAMRQFNCLGERETHEYVVPEIISQIAEQIKRGIPNPIVVRLGNNTSRDFQYAGDAVRMAVELLEKGVPGEVYNMGSESSIKIYELARLIGKIMGVDVEIEINQEKFRPWDIEHLESDNSKLYSVINTRPQVSLTDGLERTIKYFYDNSGWDF